MVSDKFQNPGVRSIMLLICICSFAGAGYEFAHLKYLSAIVLMLTGLIFVMLVIKIYNTADEAITYFFNAVRNDDTTINFQTDIKNKSLKNLYESINLLTRHFQDIKLRNEYNETYYKSIIQNASIGLLVINTERQIELINRVACNYAGISPDSINRDQLKIKHPAFYEAVCNLKPGENITYRNLLSDNLQILLFKAIMISKKDATLKLVSIQDIRTELEARELDSYRKLMSVMTHEIMNLLTPMTTVAREVYSTFYHIDHPKKISEIDEANFKTAVNGLMLIDEQSNGLINFVNNYRKISKLPQPVFTTIDVEEWIGQLKIVYSGKMMENHIYFSINSDKTIKHMIADKNLLNQVIINLINNSYDAVMEIEGDRRIDIRVLRSLQNKVLIKITNNGPLIPVELQEKIFVPFFTTKKNGSGIGLSISQEIIKLHNGSLALNSTIENQTTFVIEF